MGAKSKFAKVQIILRKRPVREPQKKLCGLPDSDTLSSNAKQAANIAAPGGLFAPMSRNFKEGARMSATANNRGENFLLSIPIGAAATRTEEVTRELTVAHFHADMPEVYGTPMMIYLMEVAAAEAIHPYLPEGWVSVGVTVNVKHLAATPVGFTVTARAEVVAVNEQTVVFTVEAHDGAEKIGEGTHVRAPIELSRFEKRVRAKAKREE
jgi:fluoroacetyl-CoA thioesterase